MARLASQIAKNKNAKRSDDVVRRDNSNESWVVVCYFMCFGDCVLKDRETLGGAKVKKDAASGNRG